MVVYKKQQRLIDIEIVFVYHGKYMSRSKFQIAREDKIKEKAINLYKQGLSTRKVSKLLKELEGITRSHTWVFDVVKQAGI